MKSSENLILEALNLIISDISYKKGVKHQLQTEIEEYLSFKTKIDKEEIEMVFVKGNDKINDFSIGKYPVTQKQWVEIMGNNPSRFKGDDLPVESVSWNDTQEFIKKLNTQTKLKYRLPTEVEWEYAAMGGKNYKEKYEFSGSNIIDDVAWFYKNSKNQTHSVGQKQPNQLGIYDMSGNVWEWCEKDYYSSKYYKNNFLTNRKKPGFDSGCMHRGGSWRSLSQNCCVTLCSYSGPNDRSDFIGFRLAL